MARTVAGEVTIQIDVATGESALPRYGFTYADSSVNADPAFGEQFTVGDFASKLLSGNGSAWWVVLSGYDLPVPRQNDLA
jgi:hypothetical protein